MKIVKALAPQAPMLSWLDQTRPFSAHWGLCAWQDELALPASRVWYAEEEGQIIGFIALRGAVGDYEITNLAVAASRCRQGIGRRLVAHVLDELKKEGASQLTLEVSAANVPAQRLYQQAGFHPLGVRKQFYKDGSDALLWGINL